MFLFAALLLRKRYEHLTIVHLKARYTPGLNVFHYLDRVSTALAFHPPIGFF